MRHIFNKLKTGIFCLFLCTGFANAAALSPTPLHTDVRVDFGTSCGGVACTGSSLASSNTTRKLAVGADGVIYVLFHGAQGVRIARSTDRGASFSTSVQVTPLDVEAEIALSTNGTLYVAWIDYTISAGQLSKSVDGGLSWSAPVTFAPSALGSFHMAAHGNYVYLIPQDGSTLYSSADGGLTFNTTSTGTSWVFADVHVDPVTGYVYIVVDNPSVSYYTSTDHGASLSPQVFTGVSVFYSVGALSSGALGNYLFMAGSMGSALERIDITGTNSASIPVEDTPPQTRSLAADIFGNVVVGYMDGPGDLYFVHSNDLGDSMSVPTLVASGAVRANADINLTNGDIIYLYEKNDQIYLSVYGQGLVGYGVTVSPSTLDFGVVDVGASATKTLTLTNTTASALSLDSLTASGDFSFVSSTCGTTLALGASCTVQVKFTPSALGSTTGSFSFTAGGLTTRSVALVGTSLVRVPAAATPVPTLNGAALALLSALAALFGYWNVRQRRMG